MTEFSSIPKYSLGRKIRHVLLIAIIFPAFVWIYGALYFDGVSKELAAVQAVIMLGIWIFVKSCSRKLWIFSIWFAVVLVWWISLKPSNVGNWQPDVAEKAFAEIENDEVTLHHVRNCEYRTDTDFTVRWETRKVRLSQLIGIDLFITYWGSPWMAHPILSFQFADAPPLCFSIETRKREGQSYSAVGGLYRQFDLIYIVADESDVIRLRTNYRKDEEVYLYRTSVSPAEARKRFLEYLRSINGLCEQARWYHAITTNCTTAIRSQHPTSERMPWDWRLLLNGKGDELMYERHTILTDGLPFNELKRRAQINTAAKAIHDAVDFSQRIRIGRPGMSSTSSP